MTTRNKKYDLVNILSIYFLLSKVTIIDNYKITLGRQIALFTAELRFTLLQRHLP